MADIKKITSFDGTTYDIKDASAIADASIDASLLKIKLRNGDSSTRTIMNAPFNYYGNFTGTAANTTSGSYESAKFTGNISDKYTLNSSGLPAAGTTLVLNVPVAGNGSLFVKMSVDGGTTYAPVVYNTNSTISTRYAINSKIIVTYDPDGRNASMYTANTRLNATVLGVGCWQIMDYDSNDVNYLERFIYYRKLVTNATLTQYQLALDYDEHHIVPIQSTKKSTSSAKSSGFYTGEFNPFGQIVFYTTDTDKAVGSYMADWSGMYTKYNTADLRYTFNGITTSSTSIIAQGKDVYLVATPQSNGRAKLYYGTSGTDYKSCLTTTLPTSDNGLIYIYLGIAYDYYRLELEEIHTIYYYKNGALREWTNAETSEDTDTWREIKVNGEQKIASSSSTALDLSAGSNVTLSYTDNKVVIAATDTTTTKTGHYTPSDKETAYGSASATWGDTIISGVTLDSKKHVTNVSTATLPSQPSDTKVTDAAGTGKAFILGHTTQATNATAISNASCYISGGFVYSGGAKVLTSYTNSWRPVASNGTTFINNNTSTLNISAGNNITLSTSNNTLIIAATGGGSDISLISGTDINIVLDGSNYTFNASVATIANGSDGIHGLVDSVDAYTVITEDERVTAGNFASIRDQIGLYEDYSPLWDGTFPDDTSIVKAIRDLSTDLASKTDTDTWRAVKVNGTLKIAPSSSTALDLSAGSNVTLSYTNNKVVIAAEGGSLSENITYSNLVTLKNAGTLAPGKQYRITDYVTAASQSGDFTVTSAGHQFDLIVTANTSTTLYPEAHAALHSGDTYFANSSLANWEIKYDINNDTAKYAWAGASGAKGIIYYMKDEHNNEAPYDFKNILIDGYYTFGSHDGDTAYDNTIPDLEYEKKVANNIITPYLLLNNIRCINGLYYTMGDATCTNNRFINVYNTNIHSENSDKNVFINVASSTIYVDQWMGGNHFEMIEESTINQDGGQMINCNFYLITNGADIEYPGENCDYQYINAVTVLTNNKDGIRVYGIDSTMETEITISGDYSYANYQPIIELI